MTYVTPNPDYDQTLAESPSGWRRANRNDRWEDIVENKTDFVDVTESHNTDNYADQSRILINRSGLRTVVTGPVPQTKQQAYERSRGFENFEYNHNLERFNVHRGFLIAFPCAGRRDIVHQWLEWYDSAIDNPISIAAAKRLASLATHNTSHRPRLNSSSQQSASWAVLTSLKKPESTLAAAQIALQQYGTSATVEHVLELYETHGHPTGPRDSKRIRRATSALNKAMSTFNPEIKSNIKCSRTANAQSEPTFGNKEIQELILCMQEEWPDLNVLKQIARGRRVGYEQMAFVFACMAKYSLTNTDGRVSGQAVIKSARIYGLQLHSDVYQAVKKCLIEAEWLVVTDSGYSSKQQLAKAYEIGSNAPRMKWLEGFEPRTSASSCPLPDPPTDLDLQKVIEWGDMVTSIASESYCDYEVDTDNFTPDPLWAEAWDIYNAHLSNALNDDRSAIP